MKILDLHPTHLISRLRAVAPWKIGAVVCCAGVLGSSAGMGLTWYTTHARHFCLTCHQYQRTDFERGSKLHPESVACADCHQEGHTILPTRFAAESGTVQVQCRHCHEEIVTNRQQGYKYNEKGIRITHASHLKLPGVTCVTCHYNVAHDRRDPPINRPSMEACFRCHEGKGRACTVCHPAGSLPVPPREDRLDPQTCSDCHLDWEAPTYRTSGGEFMHTVHLSAGLNCSRCHAHARRHGELTFPQGDCASDCHRGRPPSHDKGWRTGHGSWSQAGARNCSHCHDRQFCSSCHGLEMPHPDGWRDLHPRSAAHGAATCLRCHDQESCRQCHAESRPASHDGAWRKVHGKASQRNDEDCSACHERKYCGRCHEPMPHPNGWDRQAHMEAARQNRQGCTICHDEESCLACHGTAMPHGRGWGRDHARKATVEPHLCLNCHDANDCRTCHETLAPRSHRQPEWRKRHTPANGDQAQLCSLCHQAEACLSCHGLTMPHPEGWVLTHKSEAGMASGSICLRCHEKARFCGQCHGEG